MDNASKALIMAAEILIGLTVLSIMAFLFVRMSGISANLNKNIGENKILEFNNNFTKFEGRADITADEILTCYNFVQKSNKDNEVENDPNAPYYVELYVGDKKISNTNQFLKNNNTKYYYCNANINPDSSKNKISVKYKDNNDIIISKQTSLVTKIVFHETKITGYNVLNKDKFNLVQE